MLNKIWLTEALTGKKKLLDLSLVPRNSILGVHCAPEEYGFYKAAVKAGSSDNKLWTLRPKENDPAPWRGNRDMIQVPVTNQAKPLYFLCTEAELFDALLRNDYDIHASPALVERQRDLLSRLDASIIHVPKHYGTEFAVPFGDQDFATFPVSSLRVAYSLGKVPLGSLDPRSHIHGGWLPAQGRPQKPRHLRH